MGLTDFRWPLDPALAEGRDETTLARALYATPLRTDPTTGEVVPGLCTAWEASPDFRRWTFTCRSAPSIAAALKRVVRLRDAPARWLFADATRIAAGSANRLQIDLPFAWRRFPYALTVVGAAPRFVPGPFELVTGSARRVVVRREGSTVEFQRLGSRAAASAFRRGLLDEAPVPVGELAASRTDPALTGALRERRLLGLDLVVFDSDVGAGLRRAYWDTANRADYEELVPELDDTAAFGLVGTGEQARPARYRSALKAIGSLPKVRVRIGVPADPALRYGAGLLYAQWRDVGLGPRLVSEPRRPVDASFRRLLPAYPQEEALPAELVLRFGAGARARLLPALADTQQRADLERLDSALQDRVIPVAWVVDARLVSPRLVGWREDLLGNVDYAEVRSRASSRPR